MEFFPKVRHFFTGARKDGLPSLSSGGIHIPGSIILRVRIYFSANLMHCTAGNGLPRHFAPHNDTGKRLRHNFFLIFVDKFRFSLYTFLYRPCLRLRNGISTRRLSGQTGPRWGKGVSPKCFSGCPAVKRWAGAEYAPDCHLLGRWSASMGSRQLF